MKIRRMTESAAMLVMGDDLHIPSDPVIASQTITINVN